MKTLLVAGLIGLALCVLPACKNEPKAGGPGAARALTVGLVTDIGGRGDQSFNDSALRGLELWAAGKKFEGGQLAGASPAEIDASLTPDLRAQRIAPVGVRPLV